MPCRVVQLCAASVLMLAVAAAQGEQAAGDARTGAAVDAHIAIPAAPNRAPDPPQAPPPNATAVDAKPLVETGIASVYADELEGRPTASGALYDSQKLTAAHRSLPLGSRIRVTDAASGKSVSVTVNDRWGGGPGQIVNLSRRAAGELGIRGNGQRKVEVAVETIGDGRRQSAAVKSTSLLLPERIEATPTDRVGRTRVCANEADILGLREALWESHVRNCLGRKSKSPGSSVEARQ
jgi:rare lipoprotein A (peptidoglycan hydrolase)